MRPLWFLACAAVLLLAAAPSSAAKRPPRPVIASHGVKVKAGYVGACPRRARDCGIPDVFATTEPVPVHPGGFLRINTKRHVRRLWMDLDCPHRRVRSSGNRLWLFELPEKGCTIGELFLTYRRLEVTYTVNLERHRHCAPDGSETAAENEFVRIYSLKGVGYAGYPETVFFACRFDSGKTLRIGRSGCGDAYDACYYHDHAQLAGEKAAFVTGYHPDRYGRWAFTLYVLDTATWSVEKQFGQENPSGDGQGYRAVENVALKDNGSIAWIADLWDYTAAPPYWTQTYELRKNDASGRNVLLDSDPEIDTPSLRLTGSTLQWSVADEPRSATLD